MGLKELPTWNYWRNWTIRFPCIEKIIKKFIKQKYITYYIKFKLKKFKNIKFKNIKKT